VSALELRRVDRSEFPTEGPRLCDKELSTVETKITVASASAEIRRLHVERPIYHAFETGRSYLIDMSLTGREGDPRVRYDGRWRPGRFEKVGTVFALCGRELIHGLCGPAADTSVICRIPLRTVRQWVGKEESWTSDELSAMLDVPSGQVQSLMTRLALELRNPGFGSDILVELIAGQLAIELHRSRFRTPQRCGGGLAAWQLRLIEERLNECVSGVALKDIAELCRISVRHLTRAFHISHGCSIRSYVSRRRMEQAKSALIRGESIKSLAPKLGFSNVSSFTTAFRREIGLAPAAFRDSFR
jgi:AraC family transcriptional regulator